MFYLIIEDFFTFVPVLLFLSESALKKAMYICICIHVYNYIVDFFFFFEINASCVIENTEVNYGAENSNVKEFTCKREPFSYAFAIQS